MVCIVHCTKRQVDYHRTGIVGDKSVDLLISVGFRPDLTIRDIGERP